MFFRVRTSRRRHITSSIQPDITHPHVVEALLSNHACQLQVIFWNDAHDVLIHVLSRLIFWNRKLNDRERVCLRFTLPRILFEV